MTALAVIYVAGLVIAFGFLVFAGWMSGERNVGIWLPAFVVALFWPVYVVAFTAFWARGRLNGWLQP